MEKPEAILSAALKLFVQYGFHGTPTSKIAVVAGVSNGTLFHYFKTKDELVVALYNHVKDDLNGFLAMKVNEVKTYKEKFKSLFINSVQWALVHKEEYYFIQQFHYSPHLSLVAPEDIAKQNEMHQQLLGEAIKAGVFKKIAPEMIGVLSGSQINGMYQYLVNSSLSETKRNKLINESFELVWLMLSNPDTQ